MYKTFCEQSKLLVKSRERTEESQHRQVQSSTWCPNKLKPDSLWAFTKVIQCHSCQSAPHRLVSAQPHATASVPPPRPTTGCLQIVSSSIHASVAIVKLQNQAFLLPLAFAAKDRPCLQQLPADPLSPSGTSFRRFLANTAGANHSPFDHAFACHASRRLRVGRANETAGRLHQLDSVHLVCPYPE